MFALVGPRRVASCSAALMEMTSNDVDKVCAKCDTIIEAVTCAQVRRSERVPERILALCIRNVPVTLETQAVALFAYAPPCVSLNSIHIYNYMLGWPSCWAIIGQ